MSIDVSPDTPLNDVQKSTLASVKTDQTGANPVVANEQAKKLQTYQHGASFLQPDASSDG